MSIVEKVKIQVEERVREWLVGVAIKKAVVSAAKAIVAFAMAQGISFTCTLHGTQLDIRDEAAMTIALNSGLTVARNWLKIKYPKLGKWL